MSMAMEDINEVIVGAVVTLVVSSVEDVEDVEEVELMREEVVVVEVSDEEVAVLDGVDAVEGEMNEVNEVVEVKPPVVDFEVWLLVFGHRAFTPFPFLKEVIMSFPGSCTFAQAWLISEVSDERAFEHDPEQGFPPEKSEVLQPEIDCV